MIMYVGVDIGGTKTLVAVLNDQGVILERIRFLTPPHYEEFINALESAAQGLQHQDFRAGCVGAPGKIDRDHGIGRDFGNLRWHNVPIQSDAERIFRCPMLVENDANLGGLSESMLLPRDKRVLYVTVSTGIGTGFIDHQHIAPELANSEGGHMLLPFQGKRMLWESFASGRAIVKRFGKKAAEITDEATWRRIAHDLSLGFVELIAIAQPDIIVIGGGVGTYYERFEPFLLHELEKIENPMVSMPSIRKAARPEDAVLYGCYDLAHTVYGSNT
jgi:predicted NBD/HSP70 family sugar kinase